MAVWSAIVARSIVPKSAQARAPIFWLHIDRIDNANGYVWAVKWKGRYYYARKVWINVPLAETVYLQKPQPRAYIRGEGHVNLHKDGVISID